MRKSLFNIELINERLKDIDTEGIKKHFDEHGTPKSDEQANTHSEDIVAPICGAIEQVFDQAQAIVREQLGWETIVTDWWGHVHEKNMSTDAHRHGADISCVYYVDVPVGGGDIAFCVDQWRVPPVVQKSETNSLLIFPSWLIHSVSRNKSDEKRVSLSFNLEVTGPAEKAITPEIVND